MSVLSSAAVKTLSFVRGESRYDIFDQIAGTIYESPGKLAEIALASAQGIADHAYHTTSFYRRIMDAAGVHPARIASPEDLARIPVIGKDDVRHHREDMFSSAADPAESETKSTSGSSGTPLTFLRDKSYYEMGAAGTMRNMALAGWKPGDAVAYLWGYEKNVENLKTRLKSSLSRKYLLNAFEQNDAWMTVWLNRLRRRKIQYIYGYPSSLYMFGRFILDKNLDLSLKAVFCTAERYFPFEREVIESAFHCKSYDLYGSSEIQNIAFECSKGNLHISTDFVLVQNVQDAEEPLPRLIMTSFHNRCMPFIRYELGDYGKLLPGECSCGIRMPLMELYGGSKYDFLVTPSGVIHGAVLERIFNKVPGISRYQIVQHNVWSYTIRAELSSSDGRDAITQQIEQGGLNILRKTVGPDVVVRFEYPAKLMPGPNGKYRFVYRE